MGCGLSHGPRDLDPVMWASRFIASSVSVPQDWVEPQIETLTLVVDLPRDPTKPTAGQR